MDTLILDAIIKQSEACCGGVNLIHLEHKFPELDRDEISGSIERLIVEGEIERKNYLLYPLKSN